MRNEPDGSVTVVAEGTRREIEAFVEAVKLEMRGYVRRADVAWGAATGAYDGFGVAF